MRSTFVKLASLSLLAVATWVATGAIASRASKLESRAQEPQGAIRVGVGEPYVITEPKERVKYVPQPFEEESVEIMSVDAKEEGAFTHITGSAEVFTRRAGTKYFWVVNITGQDGASQDIVFEDTLTALPEGQLVEPTLDKILPLDSGEYTLKIRMQLIPPALAGDGLDNPILYRQCGVAEASREVIVL